MTGLEKIINKIDSDNAVRCEQIIASAEKKAEAIKTQAKEEAQIKAEEIIDSAKAKCAKTVEIQESRNAQIQKQVILNKKINLINDVICAASQKLDTLSDSEYFDFLIKLIGKYACEGKCELLLNEKDNARMTESFKSKAVSAASEKNAELTLSDKLADIRNGFILKYGLIEINCSFDSIIDENREELKEKVNAILF